MACTINNFSKVKLGYSVVFSDSLNPGTSLRNVSKILMWGELAFIVMVRFFFEFSFAKFKKKMYFSGTSTISF